MTTPAYGATAIGRQHFPRRVAVAAGVWSALTAIIGLWWTLRPSAYLLGQESSTLTGASLIDEIEARPGAAMLLTFGVVGMVAAAMLQRELPVPARAALLALAAAYGVIFGLVVPDLQVIMLIAYLVVGAGPLGLVLILVFAAIRGLRPFAIAMAVLATIVVAGWTTGIADGATVGTWASRIIRLPLEFHRPMFLLLFLVGGMIWAAVAVVLVRLDKQRCARCGRPGASWTRPESAARWGRWVTIAAALCALPYGLQRLTWLTPWPTVVEPSELAANPEIRLHGLLLGLASIGGCILTFGLIQRWGEVWPHWIPRLGGRPVPPPMAIIPGALLAAAITVSGISLTLHMDGDLIGLGFLPLPIWGPLLGAATLAYYYRRRPPCRQCGRIEDKPLPTGA